MKNVLQFRLKDVNVFMNNIHEMDIWLILIMVTTGLL